MTHLDKFTDEQLKTMKETAYGTILHLPLLSGKYNCLSDIMAIALVEINRELNERELNETQAGG